MKTLYVDKTAEKECAGYFLKDCELIWAGSTVSSVPLSERKRHGEEYERFAREYGIQFFFEDNAAVPEFYTVPWTEVFASDGEGGFLAVLNGDVQSEGAVCLISADRKYKDVNRIRKLAFSDLQLAMREALRFTLTNVSDNCVYLPLCSVQAYNQYVFMCSDRNKEQEE